MSKLNSTITVDRLRELLSYSPDTGVFRWLTRPNSSIQIGDIAGSLNQGYLRITADGNQYLAHRLAWVYVNGVWPTDGIDHINGSKSDNRICNLREATHSENLQNLRKARADSITGLLGAHLHKPTNTFMSKIKLNGKVIYLGHYSTSIDAHHAYLSAKEKLHPFAPGLAA